MSSYTLIIPGRLPGQNEINNANRTRNLVGAKQKLTAEHMIFAEIRNQLHNLKINRRVDVDITFYEPNRKRDKDNIFGGIKFILDALVYSEVLANDNWKWIGYIHPEFEVDADNPRIEVKMTEVGDEQSRDTRHSKGNRVRRTRELVRKARG